jgi:dTDP-L-rhamnose 4-epimerase
VYALSKYDQERLCLLFGEAYDVPAVALRLFNVYGPRQALSNPYTGVLAIFAARLLNGRAPLVFEDGGQRRDFVNVRDVVRAFVAALETDGADGAAVNVGSGRSVTVTEVAAAVARVLDLPIEPELTGKFRAGDIRHCFADVGLARELLGHEAAVELDEGLEELADWMGTQSAVDRVDEATRQLAERGLAR